MNPFLKERERSEGERGRKEGGRGRREKERRERQREREKERKERKRERERHFVLLVNTSSFSLSSLEHSLLAHFHALLCPSALCTFPVMIELLYSAFSNLIFVIFPLLDEAT
jgi:hypothetical protein